jgi:eukaryotic-like serine/threonine-protein kinase
MGEVWSGVRLEDGEPVAIKVLLSAASTNPEVVARFKREAQVLAMVKSEFVSGVLDFFSDPDFGLILVMELIQGESMLAMLRRAKKVSVEAAIELGADIARGLRDLHNARIVHRDLKPGNIVLRPMEGRMPRAMLIDFGMSRVLSGGDPDEEVTAITRGDRVLGTLEYIAPEQVLVARNVTGSADLYALGCIMFRAIAGHHVYGDAVEGKLVAEKLNNDAPPVPTGRDDEVSIRTQALVAKLLARRLRERYQKAEEVLAEMEEIEALAHAQPEVHARQEEQELATVFRPAISLALATAQAMRDTVQAYQVESTPGPSAPSQPRVASAAEPSPRPAPLPQSGVSSLPGLFEPSTEISVELSGVTVPDTSAAAQAARAMLDDVPTAEGRALRAPAPEPWAALVTPAAVSPAPAIDEPAIVPAVQLPAAAPPAPAQSGSSGFVFAIMVALVSGCLVGWILFRQLQSRALLPGNHRSVPAAISTH